MMDDLLDELAKEGLRLRMLCEREVRVSPHLPTPTKWQWFAQLMHANGFVDSDLGDSAYVAIGNALHRAKGLRGPDNRPMSNHVIINKPVPKEAPKELEIDMDDLIGAPKKSEPEIDLDDLI